MGKVIPIHPNKGLMPRICFCQMCGKDTDEMTMGRLKKLIIRKSGTTIYYQFGEPITDVLKRARLGHLVFSDIEIKEVSDSERVPATEPCEECKNKLDKQDQVLKEGGVMVECEKCGKIWVVDEKHPIAKETRRKAEEQNITERPLGIKLLSCKQHAPPPKKRKR